MKHFSAVLFLLMSMWHIAPSTSQATSLQTQLSGRILLQVESHGEAWYVDPVSNKRYFLGRPELAYQLMRTKGLGIRHAELTTYLAGVFPTRLAGRIVLDVEQRGEAYYILPTTRKGIYLGKPADALGVMRTYGLGITNRNLSTITIATDSPIISSPASTQTTSTSPAVWSDVERETFDLIQDHRQSLGLTRMQWSNAVAEAARQHSADMAAGRVPFSHDGFEARTDRIRASLAISGAAENVAYNQGYDQPAASAVEGWLESDGHRRNIENGRYTHTGIGIVKTSDDTYYFTQMFVTVP